ncbi:hypothetical protein [Caballeronia sordidicola]|uniref:hypothetical protein n=1 Tax=Caballeronia sordidicola TaxID=196367 RepID=UPI00117EEF84|nr:hypothetical protein [Caballeronia sordidicola]
MSIFLFQVSGFVREQCRDEQPSSIRNRPRRVGYRMFSGIDVADGDLVKLPDKARRGFVARKASAFLEPHLDSDGASLLVGTLRPRQLYLGSAINGSRLGGLFIEEAAPVLEVSDIFDSDTTLNSSPRLAGLEADVSRRHR